MIDSVVCAMNGSILAVLATGTSSMSLVDRLPAADAAAVETEAVGRSFRG
jgi:hypothetical protein